MSKTSSSWLDTYMSALDVRDRQEQAVAALCNNYTKLADYCGTLASQQEETKPAPATSSAQPESPASTTPTQVQPAVPPRSILGIATPLRANTAPVAALPNETTDISKLRVDLSAAQKSKTALSSRLASVTAQLSELEASHGRSTATLGTLNRDKSVLERRLKDRDAELREKRALLEQVQDEVVGLEMQVNVAEEEKRKLKEENASLVRRLVEVREAEVERVNKESGWGEK